MPLKQYFCGSLYSLEKKGLSLFGIPQVVQVLTMEERRTDNLFFFKFFDWRKREDFVKWKEKPFYLPA